MSTTTLSQSVQVKVTLPLQLQQFIQSKASKFGMSVSSYLKHLALNDVADMDMPTFPMSQKMEEKGEQAIQEYRAGKTISVHDANDFFKTL